MVKDSINKFFYALSNRLRNENDLSDVTYALCQASPLFSRLFLEYMFPNLENTFNGFGFWEREVCSEIRSDSRIDFLYIENSQKYVIENKINDKNTHDEQYKEAFPDGEFHRAFIANYSFNNANKYYENSATWIEFLTYLKNQNIQTSPENSLINGYISFVSELINFMEVKPMNFTNLGSITSFFNMIDQITYTKGFTKWHNNNKLEWSQYSCLGKWFNDANGFNYYICINLIKEKPQIELWVRKSDINDMPILINNLRKKENNNQFKYIGLIDYDSEQNEYGIGFDLNEVSSNVFFKDDSTVDNQTDCISKFIDEVYNFVNS